MSVDSTVTRVPRKSATRKPKAAAFAKPHPDFPLSIHKGTGYWSKKVRGRVYYFGKVADDPKGKAALEEWLNDKDDLLAGREPREKRPDGCSVADLCEKFQQHKEDLLKSGELSQRTFGEYFATGVVICSVFGKNRSVEDLVPDDFRRLRAKLAVSRKAIALRNAMVRVRSIFKYGLDDGLYKIPVSYGKAFELPKLDVIRRAREAHRDEHGDRMFEADELRLILDALAGLEVTVPQVDPTAEPVKILRRKWPALRVMTLVAANCGFGQSDLSTLPTRAVNLETGWIDYARPKTGIRRKCPLWPETVSAIREYLIVRPKPKDAADAGILFLTSHGQRWVQVNQDGAVADAIGREFAKLLRRLKLKRPRVSFYALRHTFETIGGDTADQVAVDAIMGHVPQGMSANYRERISDDRLRAVVEHVRRWLWPVAQEGGAQNEI